MDQIKELSEIQRKIEAIIHNYTTINQIKELSEIQRKIEAIIHGTTEEMRDKQPGVMTWRNDILRKITEYRVELVNRLKEVPL